MSEKSVLAIGDVQGNMRRLEALLLQEGILGPCEVCGGSGDVSGAEEDLAEFCPACKGSGTARIRHDVTVVQLGDLIDASWDTQTNDSLSVHFADSWVDVVLWGNHDRPVIDPNPAICFGGYATPLPETIHKIKLMRHEDRFRLAYEAHGFLLVHAGVPAAVAELALLLRPEQTGFANYLNQLDRRVLDLVTPYQPDDITSEIADFIDLRDHIGYYRGGPDQWGGLLWRDEREALYQGVRQVFGHSSADHVRTYPTEAGDSYCLDLSKHGGIGALWLPEERVVETSLC